MNKAKAAPWAAQVYEPAQLATRRSVEQMLDFVRRGITVQIVPDAVAPRRGTVQVEAARGATAAERREKFERMLAEYARTAVPRRCRVTEIRSVQDVRLLLDEARSGVIVDIVPHEGR